MLPTLAAVTFLAGLAVAVPAPAAAQPSVEVTLDEKRMSVGLGDRLAIRARIVNAGTEPTERLVAHLNVATLDSRVYVDLEDWTASPTQELASLPPGESASATWVIQAVNAGRFNVYVVVLPNGPTSAGQGPLVVSPPQLVDVAGRRTLSPQGALPVAVIEPVLLGLVAAAVRLRLRRER
jgi:hypothetical protein